MTSTSRRRSSLPTLSIFTRSTSSTSISPMDAGGRLPSSAPQHQSTLQPSEEADKNPVISPGDQSILAPSDYLGFDSRLSSPNMFTNSNMPSASGEHRPMFLEYDRDAALAERASRNTLHAQHCLDSPSTTLPSEPLDPSLMRTNTSTFVAAAREAVMEPRPVHAGEREDGRAFRSRTRKGSGHEQRNERRPSHYDRERQHRNRNEAQSSSFHSASSAAPTSMANSAISHIPRTPHDNSSEVDIPHIIMTEPPQQPAESTRSRPPMRSFIRKLPIPWDARLLPREDGEAHSERPTPDRGASGQFWTSRSGAERGRKWFGRNGSRESEFEHDDDFVP